MPKKKFFLFFLLVYFFSTPSNVDANTIVSTDTLRTAIGYSSLNTKPFRSTPGTNNITVYKLDCCGNNSYEIHTTLRITKIDLK